MDYERLSFDKYILDTRVIYGECALNRVGLTTTNGVHLMLFTKYKEIDGVDNGFVGYYYKENIDYDKYLEPMYSNKSLLLPTKERAIVEYILLEKWCDEGVLIEALKNWLWYFKDMDKMYEVCDYFKLPRETIDYWIKEAEEDDSILSE